jgi:hypothetical protein
MANREEKGASSKGAQAAGGQPLVAKVEAGDTIAHNRALPFTPAAEVPVVPQGFQKTELEEIKRRLRLMADELIAESLRSLKVISQIGDVELEKDLGDMAPKAALAGELETRLEEGLATWAALTLLVEYNGELLSIVKSDVIKYLEAAYGEYQHRVGRKPQLATKYKTLAEFFAARSQAISDGIAQAKAERTRKTQMAETGDADKGDKEGK